MEIEIKGHITELADYLDGVSNMCYIRYNSSYNTHIFTGKYGRDDIIVQIKPHVDTKFSEIMIGDVGVTTFDNNRFHKFLTGINTTCEIYITHPVAEEDRRKLIGSDRKRILETYGEYERTVKPYILYQDITWIKNILSGKSEQEHILYENNMFILLPDPKWDGVNLDELYCLAIVRDHNLRSLRDLTTTHLPLLESIYRDGLKAIKDRYGVKSNSLRVYVHYHPSFWHLHVHFNLVKNVLAKASIGNAHSIVQIMENIKIDGEYYQKVPLEIIGRSSVIF